ncbi:hypothetical protein RSAG8_01828, partial [Rhizoctonia solani AG-8 WAC10335]
MIHLLALCHSIHLKFASFHLAFAGHRRYLTNGCKTHIFYNTFVTMPPTSRRANKKNPKLKQGQKQPRSPSKSETERGSDSSRIVTDDAIYFFRPKVEHGYLSQWYASPFTDGIHTKTRNRMLFAPDSPVTSAILETTNPRDIKALGRMIPNFDEAVWKRERLNIVAEGSRLKFRQSEALKAQLLATGDKELVEASPFDRIWGVGFGAKQAPTKRGKWGENLLGKALMAARQELREEVTSDNIDSAPKLGSRRGSLESQYSPEIVNSLEEQHPPVRNKDTCPGGGPDPIHNYMDYSYDICMNQFTPGQFARIKEQVKQYRELVCSFFEFSSNIHG